MTCHRTRIAGKWVGTFPLSIGPCMVVVTSGVERSFVSVYWVLRRDFRLCVLETQRGGWLAGGIL